MLYLAGGGRYLVFASKAGADDNPAWYRNLKANPDARIEVGDDIVDVHATELWGAERDEKYALQAERYPGFGEYQRKTSRGPSQWSRSLLPVGRSRANEGPGDRRDGAVRPSCRHRPRRPENRRPRRRPRSGPWFRQRDVDVAGLRQSVLGPASDGGSLRAVLMPPPY
jgi:deazaflavin-dependent oxidoreductase (nitroreductase family)